jgi:hypothetical protein
MCVPTRSLKKAAPMVTKMWLRVQGLTGNERKWRAGTLPARQKTLFTTIEFEGIDVGGPVAA